MTRVTVDLSNSPGFTPQAVNAIENVLATYSSNIIEECNRLAAAETFSGNSPEITAAIVAKANEVFKLSNNIYISKKPPKWLRISSAVVPVATGIYPNLVNMEDPLSNPIVIGLLLLSAVLIAALTMMDYSK